MIYNQKVKKILDESIIRRYVILNPNINQSDEIMKKHLFNYNKGSERYSFACVLKPLSTSNRVRHTRNNTKLNLDNFFNFSKNSISSKINQNQKYFSHL